ncbi:tetratricopeptide repeat domain protein, partial [Desulfovibrio piger ATCC 29098]
MNGKRLLPLCGLICATAMLGACVGQSSSSAANESMYLEQRVQEHDTLLRQMQPAQAEVWNQVQAMRQELNTLKGLVDDLKNVGGAAALAERVRAHDAALRQVETSMALNLNLGEPMAAGGAAPAHAAAPQANAPLFQPQQNPYAAPAAGAA